MVNSILLYQRHNEQNRNVFHEKTGAYDIAGGNDAVVAWEFRRTDEHGAIICIGSG
ncbi:MAG: DUF4960 domain-containing protein, partial [Bacteroidales bacterium]|nr:DUF4960 domain-containing protein [Bacteroidales bacterium]